MKDDLSGGRLVARNKIATDGHGRITTIDIYSAPQVSEPIEPFPHDTRIVYSYDKDGKPTKREVFDPETSMTEPDMSATFKHDAQGRWIKLEGTGGGFLSRDYNEKGQLIRTQFFAPNHSKGEYETYEYNAQGKLVKKNWYYSADSKIIDKYQEHRYDDKGVLKETELYLWSKTKQKYTSFGVVKFKFDTNQKSEDVYFPTFYFFLEDPFYHIDIPDYYLTPGMRQESLDLGDGLSYVFHYELSSKIVSTDHVGAINGQTKVYKNGQTLIVEGLDIVRTEIHSLDGKLIFNSQKTADRLDIPTSHLPTGLYLISTTDKNGRKQVDKVSL
ncbi:MAG: T9SS type A sorting domain-containing protein [Porphyromonadaceae bacterium]|nr:T9SS type A sorting domain-containing protein [Porphyromonadaceae bacterium]